MLPLLVPVHPHNGLLYQLAAHVRYDIITHGDFVNPLVAAGR